MTVGGGDQLPCDLARRPASEPSSTCWPSVMTAVRRAALGLGSGTHPFPFSRQRMPWSPVAIAPRELRATPQSSTGGGWASKRTSPV